jgi:hypothetical protein
MLQNRNVGEERLAQKIFQRKATISFYKHILFISSHALFDKNSGSEFLSRLIDLQDWHYVFLFYV